MTQPIRVLLADESAAVRLLLSSLLHDDGDFTVIADVATGEETLALCPNADLVIVDLVLADTDAFSLIEKLHAQRPGLPVVVYAEVDPPYLRDEASTRGASGYFSTRMDPSEVLDGFRAAARTRRSDDRGAS